ncbi:MAG: hypothetical protein JNJ43_16925 [Anaerolineales bacterium]|nr:hypothetical protein [Anaerolineales bacterium]
MESLLSLVGCFATPLILLVSLVIGGWIVYTNLTGNKKYSQERQSKLSDLRKRGITAPATIVSAKNGIVNTRGGSRLMLMTLEVEVQPEGRSKFVTTFKDWLPVGRQFVSWGDRHEEVGQKIWVTYNPNDLNEILFEHYDKDRKYFLGYPAFAKLEKRNAEIRNTGEEAIATILETEDLELVHSYEKEMRTVLRVKLEVTPKIGEPYQAEAQNSFLNASLHKYTVGKKVYVKFNPQDKTQVALIRSAEE